MLAFVHIEKTAGTSLIHILRHNFFLKYMDVRPCSNESTGTFNIDDLKAVFHVNPFLQAIGGHSVVPYNGLEVISPNIKYITLLRDPIKRYISQYRHWVEKKHMNISIQEFLNHREIWNYQTRKLAGSENLEAAKKILEEKFSVTGTVENFDEFLVLLRHSIGSLDFDIRYTIQNTASDRSVMNDTLKEWDTGIRERNELDIALYEFVKNTLVPRQKAQYGDNFTTDLQAFKQLNLNGPVMMKRYIDYIYRKLYTEPATGLLRISAGLPYKGSY